MRTKDIKIDSWYETTRGLGKATNISTYGRPQIQFNIVSPIPRGTIWLKPMQVLYEIDPPQTRPE